MLYKCALTPIPFYLLQVLARLEKEPAFAKETVERHLLKEVELMIITSYVTMMINRQVLCCAGIHRNNILFNTSRCKIYQIHLLSA